MDEKRLLNKNCVVVDISLAVILGLHESIIIQQMNYWLEKSNHIIEGRAWIYNSYAAWQKQLPFLCERTIRRTINKLEIMGIILSGNFNKLKMDKTKWYSLNYDILDKFKKEAESIQCCECNFHKEIIDESNTDNGQSDQLHDDLDKSMRTNCPMEVDNDTKALPETTTETNYREEEEDLKVATSGAVTEKGTAPEVAAINFFNSNIHLITPHECEKLKLLHEEIKNPELILKAMELAVENRARSFRYIEVILYNWMELDLHTLQEVEDYISSNTSVKNYNNRVIKGEERDGNHGENKCSKWGSGQYFGDYKQAQGKDQGKYAGFKPEKPTIPELTEEDYEGLI